MKEITYGDVSVLLVSTRILQDDLGFQKLVINRILKSLNPAPGFLSSPIQSTANGGTGVNGLFECN